MEPCDKEDKAYILCIKKNVQGKDKLLRQLEKMMLSMLFLSIYVRKLAIELVFLHNSRIDHFHENLDHKNRKKTSGID